MKHIIKTKVKCHNGRKKWRTKTIHETTLNFFQHIPYGVDKIKYIEAFVSATPIRQIAGKNAFVIMSETMFRVSFLSTGMPDNRLISGFSSSMFGISVHPISEFIDKPV